VVAVHLEHPLVVVQEADSLHEELAVVVFGELLLKGGYLHEDAGETVGAFLQDLVAALVHQEPLSLLQECLCEFSKLLLMSPLDALVHAQP